MTINSADDLMRRSKEESNFFKAVRGTDESCIAKIIPAPVRFLANEVSILGDQFVSQTIEKHSMVDENGKVLIEFDSLIQSLQRFEYICSKEDRNELRTWLFNSGLFVSAPRYYDRHSIFISVDALLKALRSDSANDSARLEHHISLDAVSHSIRETLIQNQVGKALEALHLY